MKIFKNILVIGFMTLFSGLCHGEYDKYGEHIIHGTSLTSETAVD